MQKLLDALEQLKRAEGHVQMVGGATMASRGISLAIAQIEKFIREESGIDTHSPTVAALNREEDENCG